MMQIHNNIKTYGPTNYFSLNFRFQKWKYKSSAVKTNWRIQSDIFQSRSKGVEQVRNIRNSHSQAKKPNSEYTLRRRLIKQQQHRVQQRLKKRVQSVKTIVLRKCSQPYLRKATMIEARRSRTILAQLKEKLTQLNVCI